MNRRQGCTNGCAWLRRFISGLFALVVILSAPARALILDDEDVLTIVLSDGTQVTLYGEADTKPCSGSSDASRPNVPELAGEVVGKRMLKHGDEVRRPYLARSQNQGPRFANPTCEVVKTKRYYYLPVSLHLSQRPDPISQRLTPEFLFLKFTTENREDQGGVSGAIMHFLMEWGLTPSQEQELRSRLEKIDPGAELRGAAPMEPQGETGSFQIISATLSDQSMTPTVVTSGKAPLVPGGKAAVAARLSANGAQLLAASFEKARSITDVSIALDFTYQTLIPAANGSITFHWDKLQAEHEIIDADYAKEVSSEPEKPKHCGRTCRFILSKRREYAYTYSEVRELYKFLEETKVVELYWTETYADERVDKVREAFFDYFLQSMTDVAPPPPPSEPQEPYQTPDIQQGTKYTFNRESLMGAFERKTDSFDLRLRLPIRKSHQLVGNLAEWYDHARDNPKCVASVNLNDPFFQHRDIHFILDLDAKEMFDEAINYVTVNVRKNRTGGRPFEDRVTIDAEYVRERGINATVTYARGEDRRPDAYEYQVQWSLKGGDVIFERPTWQKGSWEGVTLKPPVIPRTLEFEADLGEMARNEITRVTAQVHYWKFGKEVEENIHISPARGEPLVTKKIFTDRDRSGYAYRLIVNHKREGKLVLPSKVGKDGWDAQINDDYIYAVLPPDLLSEPTLLEQAKEAAADLADAGKEKVLERFKELLPGGSKS